MIGVYSHVHRLHKPVKEFTGGDLIEAFDTPDRNDRIFETVQAWGALEMIAPQHHDRAVLLRAHTPDYLDFLQTAYECWTDAGFSGDVMASIMPFVQSGNNRPDHIEGQVGYYTSSLETAIAKGTWQASVDSADIALTAKNLIASGKTDQAFALCRPPGHHAMAGRFGGYCYLNNAALCAQTLLDDGASRIAILDVDFHHGNGTQDIFYHRNDVLFCSVHGDPRQTYPFFYGYADEHGVGDGEGFTLNVPLVPGSTFESWHEAFTMMLKKTHDYGPDALIVSLGVDAHADDPQSFFTISTKDYASMGAAVRQLNRPTVVVMEGGYNLQTIGACVVAFLSGLTGS